MRKEKRKGFKDLQSYKKVLLNKEKSGHLRKEKRKGFKDLQIYTANASFTMISSAKAREL